MDLGNAARSYPWLGEWALIDCLPIQTLDLSRIENVKDAYFVSAGRAASFPHELGPPRGRLPLTSLPRVTDGDRARAGGPRSLYAPREFPPLLRCCPLRSVGKAPRAVRHDSPAPPPATLESFNPFPDSVLSALFHLDHLSSHSERVSAFSPSLGNLTTAPSITPHACTLAATAPGPRDRPPGTRRNHPQRRGPSIIRAFHDSPIPQFRWFEIGRTGERVTLEVDLVRPLRGGEEGGAVRLVLLCVAGICRECA